MCLIRKRNFTKNIRLESYLRPPLLRDVPAFNDESDAIELMDALGRMEDVGDGGGGVSLSAVRRCAYFASMYSYLSVCESDSDGLGMCGGTFFSNSRFAFTFPHCRMNATSSSVHLPAVCGEERERKERRIEREEAERKK